MVVNNLKSRKGFTLVELSLSLVFIGILSITIALIINNAISTYRRGLTLNQINTVGMDLVDDMRAAIQNAPAKIDNECAEGDMNCLQDYVSVIGRAEVMVDGKSLGENVPVYGAFCTGSYSYVWNSGYFFADDADVVPNNKAQVGVGEDFNTEFRLVKIRDRERKVCVEADGNTFRYDVADEFNEDLIVDLLSDDDGNNLALYELSAPMPAISKAGSNSSAFYSISFILGTIQGGINVMSTGNFCKAPKVDNNSFNYCAINKFNFAAQANGG